MARENRLQNAFKSSVTSALYQIVSIICGFVTSRLVIQAFGSSWNGVLTSITKFLSLFTIVEVGINGATRVALYRSFAENDLAKTSSIIRANDLYYRKVSVFLVVYVLALAVIIPNIVQADHNKWLIALMVGILGVNSFAENCWGINSKILLGAAQKRYIINLVKTLTTVLGAILLVLIIQFNGNIFVAKAGGCTIHVVSVIMLFIFTRRMFKINKHAKPDNSALKGRWDVLANSLSNIIHENVDVFFLTLFCPSTELSVYSLYYVVAGGLTKIFTIITNGIEAGFGSMWAKNEMNSIRSNLRKFEYIMYSLAIVLFGCMMVLIVPFMSLYTIGITDVNYQRNLLGILIAVAQILMSIRTPYVLLVQAAGHYKQVKLGAYIETGINIVLTWGLVIKFGIVGAIIGTIVANAFRTVQYGWYVSRHMIDRSFMQVVMRMLWGIGTLLAAYGLSVLCTHFIVVTGWLSWCVSAVIVFVIFAGLLIVTSLIFYKADFMACLNLVFSLFRRKRKD